MKRVITRRPKMPGYGEVAPRVFLRIMLKFSLIREVDRLTGTVKLRTAVSCESILIAHNSTLLQHETDY